MISKAYLLSVLLPIVVAQQTTLTDDPICIKISEPFKIWGPSKFVDVDRMGGNPAIGDFSISTSLDPHPSNQPPFRTPYFEVQEFDTDAICVFTEDTSPDSKAPTCFLETKIRVCRLDDAPMVILGSDGKRARGLVDQPGLVDDGPYCNQIYEGEITAHGSGPEPFKVTGGTRDLYGAFGIYDGANFRANRGTVQFDVTLDICFYPKRL